MMSVLEGLRARRGYDGSMIEGRDLLFIFTAQTSLIFCMLNTWWKFVLLTSNASTHICFYDVEFDAIQCSNFNVKFFSSEYDDF